MKHFPKNKVLDREDVFNMLKSTVRATLDEE